MSHISSLSNRLIFGTIESCPQVSTVSFVTDSCCQLDKLIAPSHAVSIQSEQALKEFNESDQLGPLSCQDAHTTLTLSFVRAFNGCSLAKPRHYTMGLSDVGIKSSNSTTRAALFIPSPSIPSKHQAISTISKDIDCHQPSCWGS